MSVQGSAAPRVCDKRPADGEIRAQLECLVGSAAFRNSKRYTTLLKHLVERTLEGREAELKERRLAIEVFHRPADYDPNSDPIVRTSAGELRRRIAQYYHEAASESELRIDLPVGSYVPEFRPARVDPAVFAPVVSVAAPEPRTRALRIGIALALVFVFAGFAAWRIWDRPTDLVRFWRPVLQSNSAVSLCVALSGYVAEDGDQTQRSARPPLVAVSDVKTVTRLAELLNANKQRFRLQVDDRTTLDDLRGGPAVLVGAFNDIWTIRLMDELRFRFRRDGLTFWIQDQQNPSSREWVVDLNRGSNGRPQPTRDYAVISRILTAKTGQPVIAVAGAFGPGTEIAGECVTNPAFLETIARRAPPNWEKMNAQIVISTDVIDGQPGPAAIVATHFWR